MNNPTSLPTAFSERMKAQLGENYPAFEASLQQPSPTSIRLNPRKPTTRFQNEVPVPWHTDGRYLPERPVFTLDPLFHAGAYYVQEASSMFIGQILAEKVRNDYPLRVLDLCAAPGGKTTLLASYLSDDSLLVANEVIKSRVGALKENLQKWGFPNYIVANHDAEEMAELDGFFDVVLVDAPCSGEGLFRKDAAAMNEWSEAKVSICSARQKRILRAAAQLVAEDGLLIYATCTYNAAENDENVAWLTKNTHLVAETLTSPLADGIQRTNLGFQFYPHLVQGEGFYCAILRQTYASSDYITAKIRLNRLSQKQVQRLTELVKVEDDTVFFEKTDGGVVALAKSLLADYGTVFRALQRRSSGLEIGQFKGQDFIPSHELALSNLVESKVPRAEVSKESALNFLKREDFEIAADLSDGWFLVTYEGLALGWAKKIGNRINNYFPKEWRIRMDIG